MQNVLILNLNWSEYKELRKFAKSLEAQLHCKVPVKDRDQWISKFRSMFGDCVPENCVDCDLYAVIRRDTTSPRFDSVQSANETRTAYHLAISFYDQHYFADYWRGANQIHIAANEVDNDTDRPLQVVHYIEGKADTEIGSESEKVEMEDI